MAIISLEEALEASGAETRDRFDQYLNPEFASEIGRIGFDKTFVKADGANLWDENENEYLDFMGGYGALNLGHNHSEVDEAVRKVGERPNFMFISIPSIASALAESLASVTPGDLEKVFFTSSGSEAVEGALKLARISTGKERILTTDSGYHGVTYGALSATGKSEFKEPFEPLVPRFETIPFGEVGALERKLQSGDFAAYVVEPIQGEGGVRVPPEGYLTEVQRICKETDTLFIADEIQTGLGRTGEVWACEHDDIEPDILTMAKSLSGGAVPMGAYIATDEVWQAGYGTPEHSSLHISTFMNNARGCAAGLKTLEVIQQEELAKRAKELGDYLKSQLEELASEYKLISEVRGKGLFLGVEFYEPRIGKSLSKEYLGMMVGGLLLRDHNILTAVTPSHPNVLRVEPPLIVSESQIDVFLNAFEAICSEYGSFASVAKSIAGQQLKEQIGL